MSKSLNIKDSIYPITWNIEYNIEYAIVFIENKMTKYKDMFVIRYDMFKGDTDLSEAILNTALFDIIKSSFKDVESYSDWLTCSIHTKKLSN